MTGNELNELKWKVISPKVDDYIYEFQHKKMTDKYGYIKYCWVQIEKLLLKYNLEDSTHRKVNLDYRNEIEKRILELK
jgi:hypothetical protein